MTSKPEVFIIESLSIRDERRQRFEGHFIKNILALRGKDCEYFYIRTRKELARMLNLFTESGFRYLHLSCHGDSSTMCISFDNVGLSELGSMLSPHLKSRRLFVSACGMTNNTLARSLWPDSGCFSMLGPEREISFGDAALLWASLCHVLFAADSTTISRSLLQVKAQAVADMFRVRLRYFKRQASERRGYSIVHIKPTDEGAA